MEKINVAELLKNCPQGMELDCTIFGNKVIYRKFYEETPTYPILIQTEHNFTFRLTQYGQIHNVVGAKCVIFPKGKTTWEGFVPPCRFKDGDIVATQNGIWIGIHKRMVGNAHEVYLAINHDCLIYNDNIFCFERLATEEEKQKLFGAIKANGYKWNPETKTLEKVAPKFKVGDKIKRKGDTRLTTIKDIRDNCYIITIPDYFDNAYITDTLLFSNQNEYELVPNKFDITTLKPFDRVLVRLTNNCVWMPKFFSYYDTGSKLKYYPFIITDNIGYPQCIPYEKNEYLSNTTEDCDEYYKTWK